MLHLLEGRAITVAASLQTTFIKAKHSGRSVSGGLLQRKLTIGASNDPLEREADRIAEEVLGMPEYSEIANTTSGIQRFAGQPKGSSDEAPTSIYRVLANSGIPLEPVLRQDMERRFSHDFSKVRVHTDTTAGQSAQDVNAVAYTVGNNIVFDVGQYAPWTNEGRRLIAHELTHVVQQSRADRVSVDRRNSINGLSTNPIQLVSDISSQASRGSLQLQTKKVDRRNIKKLCSLPPKYQQKGATCWAAALASWKSAITPGPWTPEYFLNFYKEYARGGSFDPLYYPAMMDREGMKFESMRGKSFTPEYVFSRLGGFSGYCSPLYVVHEASAQSSHVFVVFGIDKPGTDNPAAYTMEPQSGTYKVLNMNYIPPTNKILVGYV